MRFKMWIGDAADVNLVGEESSFHSKWRSQRSKSEIAWLLQPSRQSTVKIGLMVRKAWPLTAFVFALSLHAFPCQRATPVSGVEMVKESDVIVRAIAERYDARPKNPNAITTGVPDSTVHFHVLEVIRGDARTDLTLP